MSNVYVKRTTLFKVPKEEDIEAVLKQYEVLRKTAVKVSLSPFITVLCLLQLRIYPFFIEIKGILLNDC